MGRGFYREPLAARSRHVYISPLLQFSRETSQWGWDDVPSRPLLSRSDLPKVPSRLPRFIPRQELDRLMTAIEELKDPYQRAALLLVRWSGARRGEISRLTLDCLDAYPRQPDRTDSGSRGGLSRAPARLRQPPQRERGVGLDPLQGVGPEHLH